MTSPSAMCGSCYRRRQEVWRIVWRDAVLIWIVDAHFARWIGAGRWLSAPTPGFGAVAITPSDRCLLVFYVRHALQNPPVVQLPACVF